LRAAGVLVIAFTLKNTCDMNTLQARIERCGNTDYSISI